MITILVIVLYLLVCAGCALRYPSHRVPLWIKILGMPGLILVWVVLTIYLLINYIIYPEDQE